MARYALGTDITIEWALDAQGVDLAACDLVFEYHTGAGSRAVPESDYTLENGVLTWTFPGEEQSAYGVYGLRLTAYSDGDPAGEFSLDDAFELIHGTAEEQAADVPLQSTITVTGTLPEAEEEEEEEETPVEYVSSSPLYCEKIPLGSNIILNWRLVAAADFDFDLDECEVKLFYAASGSGFSEAGDYELVDEDGYILRWNFAGTDQIRYGLYSLFLHVFQDGALVAVLEREYAFELVHRSGSDIIADRIISFESIVTTLGGGALYALADVLNDGHSTVYRSDGETPAAQGDILLFNGVKWVASNDASLASLSALAAQLASLTARVGDDETAISNLGLSLSGALADIASNTSRIRQNELDILGLGGRMDGMDLTVQGLGGEIASLQVTSAGIATRVSDAEGNISTLQQTAQGFDLRVADVEGDVGSLQLTASSLASRITSAEGDIGSLELTASGLTTRITNAEGDIGSLELTASSLTSRIASAEGDISTLEQTATSLTSRIQSAELGVSTITQTAQAIQFQVDNQAGDIAVLQVSAQGLTSRVSNAEGNISTLVQRADAIELSVQGVDDDLQGYKAITNNAITDLQNQIDGAIETWFYSGVPTLQNQPAVNWTTDEDKNVHLGDLYYDKLTGYAYRFMVDTSGETNVYAWERLTDSDVTKALADAAHAQATADGKMKMFLVQPTPPYHLGDLWVKSDGTIYKCITEKDTEGAFSASDWASSDFAAKSVVKANFDVLANAIIGTVAAYDADGNITSATATQFAQSIDNISFSVAKVGSALLPTGINISDQMVTIRSDNFQLAGNGVGDPAALTLTYRDNVPYISVANLDVAGIFTTQAWNGQVTSLNNTAQGYANTAETNAESYADGVASTAETNAKNYANSSAYLNAKVLPMITDATSGLAVDAEYSYLKTALGNQTAALGGLLLTSLIQLGATRNGSSWEVHSGISGIYVDTSDETDPDFVAGHGIASWYGGAMVDRQDLSHYWTAEQIAAWNAMTDEQREASNLAAKTLFRMDGSGYLANGAISWGAAGDLHLLDNVYIGPNMNQTLESISTFVTLLSTWFKDDTISIDGNDVRVLRVNMASDPASTTGFQGVVWNGFLITQGDQIVGSGTPGGGSGGAGFLYELGDVFHKYGDPEVEYNAVLRAASVWSVSGTPELAQNDDLLIKTSDGWAGIPKSSVGKIYQGGSGITVNGDTISVTANTYQPLDADLTAIAGLTGTSGLLKKTAANTWTLDTSAYITGITSSMVTTALGYTPANSTSLADYLPLAGGTMRGSINVPQNYTISFGANSGLGVLYYSSFGIMFGSTSGQNAFINLKSDSTTLYWKNTNPFYHSGNFIAGTDYVAPSALANYLPLAGGTMTGTLNVPSGYLHITNTGSDAVDQWINFNDSSGKYAAIGIRRPVGSYGPTYRYSSNSGASYSYYTLYHTGNSNKDTIPWTVSSLTMANGYGLYIKDSGSTARDIINLSSSNILQFAYGTTAAGYNTYINGTNLYFRYSSSMSIGMTLDSSGNVGIGTASPAYKLDVDGAIRSSNAILTGSDLRFYSSTSAFTTKEFGVYSGYSYDLSYYDGSAWNRVYHSGNANKNGVNWTANHLYTRGYLYSDYLSNGTYRTVIDYSVSNSAILFGWGHASAGYNCYYTGNKICLYAGTTYTDSTKGITILNTGNVGVGTASPAATLDVNGTTRFAGAVTFKENTAIYLRTQATWLAGIYYGTGGDEAMCFMAQNTRTHIRFYCGQDISSWTSSSWSSTTPILELNVNGATVTGTLTSTGDQVVSSDATLKTNLQDVKYTIADIAKCRAVTFDWKDGRGHSAGSIAQDWKPLIPELVHGEEGNMTLAYGQIALINTILLANHETEQDNEINRLKEEVRRLNTENMRLKNRLKLS